MTNEQLQQLKELAQVATPGPWFVQYGDDIRHQCMTAISSVNKRDGNDGIFDDDQPLIAVTFHQSYPGVNLEGDDCGDSDSAYIAAANPAAILALIAKVESLAPPIASALHDTNCAVNLDGDMRGSCDCPIASSAPADQLPPLPAPDTHCYDEDEKRDVWSYSAELVRDYASAAIAAQQAAPAAMAKALSDLLEMYVAMVNSGDAGNWNPELEPEVKAARAAFASLPVPPKEAA